MKKEVLDQQLLTELYNLVEGKVDDYIDREKEQGKAPLLFHMPNGPGTEPCLAHTHIYDTHVALHNTPQSKIHHPDHTIPYEKFIGNILKYKHPYDYNSYMQEKQAEEDNNEQQKPGTTLEWEDGTVIGLSHGNTPIGYTYVGTPNSAEFDKSIFSKANDWKRVYMNKRGTFEVFASPSLKIYYDVDSSD